MPKIQANAIVTGGSTGIGLAIVKQLLSNGFNVGFFGSTASRVEAAQEELLQLGFSPNTFLGRTLDLRDEKAVIGFFDDYEGVYGPAGALVNNAAISPKQDGKRIPIHETKRSQWSDVLNVNLTSAFCCTQRVLPGMLEAKFGRIVMVGSIAARALPRFAGAAYVASKAGLNGLARSITSEYASNGIVANSVAPGNIATVMTGGTLSEQNIAAAKNIPTGRIGEPEDLAGIVAFLCSKQAAFINGATIDVTGGEYISP
ncbi:SDR family oxidoreductase [Amylibacter sp. SFDW26]|uniref:SDR family NAD(P)-dependent oxidoreductase n=1 Tax=Amylibacter sp. SFDW26 TaxID=2652722 RepID=UPI00126157AD|nr:SDR family NAD(P)-dependent oxidoreductase [Amylibacter sp. SFDW26]KAB7613386.1 SDR family oxidoreductase [Amylibacter sp. SFDW26]